tara:strand:+ start:297 stop:482 length:186 start_codon:yes stop_codon:yes gene_type:complete
VGHPSTLLGRKGHTLSNLNTGTPWRNGNKKTREYQRAIRESANLGKKYRVRGRVQYKIVIK